MPTAQECLRGINAEDLDAFSEEELDSIISTLMHAKQARAVGTVLGSLDESMGEAAQEILDNLKKAKLRKKLNAVRDRVRIQEVLALERRAFKATGVAGMGVRARNVGVSNLFEDARSSADYHKNALINEYHSAFISKLEEEGLMPAFIGRDQQFAEDIFREKEAVGKGRSGPATDNKQARRIAEIMHETDKMKVATENRAGASIDLRKDWLAPVTHNTGRIAKRADEWKRLVLKNADWDMMRVPVEQRESLVNELYTGFVSGEFSTLRAADESHNVFAFATKSVDVAKRASQSRRIVWRNADAWLEYNKEFGTADPVDAWLGDMQRSAANTALMWSWGSKPQQAFQEVMRQLKREYQGNPKALKQLDSAAIGNEFSEITGDVNRIVNMSGATFGRWARSATAAGLLAKAGFMTLLDIPIKAGTLRRMRGNKGFPLFEAAMSSFKGLADKETRQLGRLMGVGMQGITGEINSKWLAMDQGAGLEARLMKTYFKLNFLQPFTDANQLGHGAIIGTEVARLPKQFSKLSAEQQGVYQTYGIGEREWTLIQDAVTTHEGTRIATPGEIRNVTESVAFEGLSERAISDLRDTTRMKYGGLVADMIDSATLQQGARERAIWRRGLPAGTFAGEAMRFIGQFKGPPTAILTRAIGPALKSRGARTLTDAVFKGQGDMVGVTGLIASLTVMGVMLDQFFQLAEGRTPREWDDPDLWLDGFVRGGSAGIWADLFLLESQRYGTSATSAVAGPFAGAVADPVHRMWAQGIRGESVSTELARYVQTLTPDVIYMEAALDYLIWYQILESLNPGYLDRMERGFKSDRGQEWFIPPSRVIPHGGGNRVLEGVR